MFGPTFGNVKDMSDQSAIIISESDEEGKAFFREYYRAYKIRIFEYDFRKHDETIAYSLSIPFASSIVFGSCMKELEVPGTTFKKHLDISKGLLSEDDYLLSEILLNPFTLQHVEKIHKKLEELIVLIQDKNTPGLHLILKELRENLNFQ